MGIDGSCNVGLVLGLGLPSPAVEEPKTSSALKGSSINLEPSLTLSLSGETYNDKIIAKKVDGHVKGCGDLSSNDLCRQDSAASSFSNVSVKREREVVSDDVETATDQMVLSRVSTDEDEDGCTGRKKLRLTKAQSAFLEESFKQHSTLNPKQKQELARELNLRPRQVEVWFQNRRARTKLKQTEVDCEFLKKCCETLTEENRRLQKELQELKALKIAQPFYMQLPAATLSMCPSCERIGGVVTENSASKKAAAAAVTATANFNMAPNPSHHLLNPFTNSSAAC